MNMNILLWILQITLSFYNVAGGVYMTQNYSNLASVWALRTLPQQAWMILGILQIAFAAGLVLPGMFKNLRTLVPISAIALTIISLLGSVLYLSYAGSGVLWAVVPAILLAFIAYGRSVKHHT